MDPDKAREFLEQHHRAVLVTYRSNGELQTSPVLVTLDEGGRAIVSSRETAYKVRNLRRNPRVTACVFTDGFFGEWVQIEGTAEIVSLPDAMELLVDYYRSVAGEHDDWDEYRASMEEEQRVLVRITIEHAGPDTHG